MTIVLIFLNLIMILLGLLGLIFYFNISMKTCITITIVSLFFPVHIRFMGMDATTTGTVCIFILYLIYFIKSFNERKFIKEKYDLLIYLLIILGGLSTILAILTGFLPKDQVGHSVRQFTSFFGAMLIFLVMKNYHRENSRFKLESSNDPIEKWLNLFLILVSLHLLISMSVKFFPTLGSIFRIFLPKDQVVFDSVNRDQIQRISSFVFSYEQYAEILAMLCPILIYKFYKYKHPVWIFCVLIFSIGIIFTVTRSGIILFIFGAILSFLYYFRTKFDKTIYLLNIFIMTIGIGIYFYPSLLEDVFFRFALAKDAHKSTGNILVTMNRDNFYEFWNYIITNLKLFGNSLARVDFHNIFLSTLHQFGILGATIFFAVLLYPFVCLIKSFKIVTSTNKMLVFSCLLSMSLFLLNETKFEFNRHASSQQIYLGLFATYYLVSKNNSINKNNNI